MYGIFAYIEAVSGVNVGKYASPMECLDRKVVLETLRSSKALKPFYNFSEQLPISTSSAM